MAPHSVALRSLGIATIVYAGVLLVEPVMALRAVYKFGPVYESIVKQDMEATEQLAAAGVTAADVANAARGQMLRGAWEQVAPAVVLSAVGLLGGILLALRRRAGPWIVLLFALWPAASWALRHALSPVKLPLSALQHSTVPLVRRMIHLEVFGSSVDLDARTYAAVVRIAFLLVTLAILGWAFAAGRRAAHSNVST